MTIEGGEGPYGFLIITVVTVVVHDDFALWFKTGGWSYFPDETSVVT